MSKREWNAPSAPTKVSDGFRKQVCPHGSSLPCSQCLGPDVQAKVQKIVTDPNSGALMIGGVVKRPSLIPQAELNMIRDEMSRKMTRAHEGGRRETTCSVCGKAGHTRKTCHERSKLMRAEPILEHEVKKPQERLNRCGTCGEYGHNARSCFLFPKAA